MAIDFPSSPTNGQVYGNWIYDSSITAWRNVNTDTGIGTLNAMGLKNIVPTSISVGSGSGAVNSNGTVSFTAASSISINGCFTGTYESYKVIFKISSGTANSQVRMRLRVAGTDQTGSSLWGGAIGSHSNTTQAFSGATTFFALGDMANSPNPTLTTELTINYPQQAKVKGITANTFFDNGSTVYGGSWGGEYQIGTACDGISFFMSAAGNMTGAVQIYGLTN